MVKPVEEIGRTYEVITDQDTRITIEATSDKGEGSYGYTIEGIGGVYLSVNDTEHIIEALNRATEWINKNSEDTE